MAMLATRNEPRSARPPVNFDRRPMLVFWETTRACLLACRHCRASATTQAPPGELSHAEGLRLIEQVAGFGRPHPILILTGGDCLLRPDLFELIGYATELGVPVALAPSVTPLTGDMIDQIARSGVKAVSISLDGADAATHDGIRGIPGHFDATTAVLRDLAAAGLTVQVNTTVMTATAHQLADVAGLVRQTGSHIWEVFFLVPTGRGVAAGAISPAEHEDVCHFLVDASRYGFIVRTVEAPFFRRVVRERRAGGAPRQGHPVRRARRRGLPGRLPAGRARQHQEPLAGRHLPRGPAAAGHPGRPLHRPLRQLRVRRPVRRLAGQGLRGHR